MSEVTDSYTLYMPMDRRQAIANATPLPDRTEGSVLFADISGFTPLTSTLAEELGPERGVELLTNQLNQVYGDLINQVHRYQGSIISFAGDAITCWFDQDNGLRATAAGTAIPVKPAEPRRAIRRLRVREPVTFGLLSRPNASR